MRHLFAHLHPPLPAWKVQRRPENVAGGNCLKSPASRQQSPQCTPESRYTNQRSSECTEGSSRTHNLTRSPRFRRADAPSGFSLLNTFTTHLRDPHSSGSPVDTPDRSCSIIFQPNLTSLRAVIGKNSSKREGRRSRSNGSGIPDTDNLPPLDSDSRKRVCTIAPECK